MSGNNQSLVNLSGVEKGFLVAEREIVFTRDTLVRYAAASGDFNPIHYNDAFAQSVELPGVIAHGMLTMGAAVAVLEDAVGVGKVVDYQARFARPIPVPALGEAKVNVKAIVGAVDAESGDIRVDLTVEFEGAKVLAKAQAVVRL